MRSPRPPPDCGKTSTKPSRRTRARTGSRLTGHQQLAADYAKSRPFKAMERLMFSAAARDTALARHMYLFAARLIGPLRFLSPVAVVKALVVNVRRRSY